MITILYDILSDENIQLAINKIQSKNDALGPDGIRPSGLMDYWEDNSSDIIDLVLSGKYGHEGYGYFCG